MTTPLGSRFPVTFPWGSPGPYLLGYHTGDDYSTHGVIGVPVRATRAGTVVAIGEPWGSAYGLTVVVEGRRHRIRVGYCHLHSVEVTVGQQLLAGALLAGSGNSGHSTGPHLHYEERRRPWHYGDDRKPRFNQ